GRNDIWTVSSHPAALNRTEHRHRLFINTGDANFGESPDLSLQQAGERIILAPGDYNADGRTDLFVGSHSVPGSGHATGSRLLRNDGGTFVDLTGETAPALARLTTVTDAAWADIDGTGTLDLLVAGEWMAPTLLLNDDGRLADATAGSGLEDLTGWWQTLAVADFDRDGDPDVIAGNLGLNHPLHPSPDVPFELYVGDFDRDGQEESIPAYHVAGALYPWFGRDRMASMLPWVSERYPTLDAFARATLSEVLNPVGVRGARRFDVRTLNTTYLQNVGAGQFEPRPLPRAAQVSVAAGVVPTDFDGDGNIDLVIAGNLHLFDHSVPRLDGGVGLYLRGDGAGGFVAVQPAASGLWLEGEVRELMMLRVGPGGHPALIAAVAGGEALLVRSYRSATAG
ncbi:MAG: VCBS repeat-containing protein, partial [Gemmatimonadetes bacterium]|nr:VCBS repeat-containing protein [Gemmatimonadota bacterium]